MIYEKLARVQAALGHNVEATSTGQVGPRQYQYADLDTVMTKILPALQAEGLVIVTTIEAPRLLVTRLIDLSDPENKITSWWPLPETDDPQKLGSALTYGRRYSLVTMLGLVAGDDDDGAAAAAPQPEKKTRNANTRKGEPTDGNPYDAKLLELFGPDEVTRAVLALKLDDGPMTRARAAKVAAFLNPPSDNPKSPTEQADAAIKKARAKKQAT